MGKIYIDVSSTVKLSFTTGIQRAAKNIVQELIQMIPERIGILYYDEACGFAEMPQKALQAFLSKKVTADELRDEAEDWNAWDVDALDAGDVFLEMDACWGRFTYPRPGLYRNLKEQGVKLLVYVYDVIPVTYPQFCDDETVIWYLGYLGATLNYADGIITSTQTDKK